MDDLDGLIPQVWPVDEEAWQWLMKRLDEPPKEIPGLKELMERVPPWECESQTPNGFN